MRQAISISLILLSVNILFADQAVIRYAPSTLPADRIIPADTPIQINHPIQTAKQTLPRRDDFIGQRFEAGNTWYDYQTNGSIGKLIEVDPEGGVHVTWMDGFDMNQAVRHQKYNYYVGEEWLNEDGSLVDEGDCSGYGCLCLTSEDGLRGMVFTHCVGEPYGDEFVSVAFLDFMPGWGAFLGTIIPGFEDENTLWPQGVMSPEGIIHTVASTSETNLIGYAPGFVNNDEEIEFDVEEAIEVSETHIRAYRIARSPNSERVAIAWMNSRVGVPAPEEWDGFLAYQMNNDLFLAWTDDGEEWSFDDPLNITDCIDPDPERRGDDAYGDTYRPYCTIDLIFDADDNIHVVFDARGFWENPEGEGEPPVDRLTTDASIIFHWSEETEQITPVADGWFSQEDNDENPRPGPWKSNVCNPSLAYDEEGDLYCVYEFYPHGDHARGYCNGDIRITVSEDNGRSWYLPTPVVETPSPDADIGEATSEIYPTMAERVDDFLHIFYEEDNEPGTFVQDEDSVPTSNPFFYQQVPIDEILRDRIWQGPHFHYNEEWEYVHVLTIDEFTFENEPAPEGWVVAVFTEDDLRAGDAVWREGGVRLFVRGDDPGTEEVEGFRNGEQMTFRVYDPVDDVEYPVDVEFIAGSRVWINDRESVIMLNAYEVIEQTIALEQGWNMFSLNVIPVDEELRIGDRLSLMAMIEEFFDLIDDEGNHRVLIVKDARGDFCIPEIPYWGIRYWYSDESYIIKVTEEYEATVPGRRIDPQTEIELNAGWNLVAYYPDYGLPFYIGTEYFAFISIIDHLIIAKDGLGHFTTPDWGWDWFCEPGMGYMILVDADVTLVYPEEPDNNDAFALLKDRSTDQHNRHWSAPLSTGENMSVLVTINDYRIPLNGQIAAFSPSGKLVGAGIVRNMMCGLAVWGDDPYTGGVVEGLHGGETFELRLWDTVRDVELNLNADNILSGNGLVYETDGFTVLEVSVDATVPADYYLGQAYPNPFNRTTRITFGLPEATDVKISIFDLNGRLVKQLINRKMNAGNQTIIWDAGNIASGIYLLHMVTPAYKSVQKVMLVR